MNIMHRGINRRGVLKGTAAGLTFALTLGANPHLLLVGKAAAAEPLANAWVTIGTDGTISVVVAAVEMGQGSFTSLAAVLADELDAKWDQVKIVYPPNWDRKIYGNPEFGHNIQTSAAMAIHGYFTPMRIAGAQMRRVLMDAVAAKWNVPAAELSTEPSMVVHQATGRRIGYGEIAGFAALPAELPHIGEADLKPKERWRYIGTDVPRRDVPLKINGTAQYGIDVQIPGMVYAAVLHVPYAGGAPDRVNDAAARQIPGVTDVVRLPEGVAVVGTTVEATQRGVQQLEVTWTNSHAANFDSDQALNTWAAIARNKKVEGIAYEPRGDARTAIAGAAKVVRGEYQTSYLSHAAIEPLNATAHVTPDGKVEIWAGGQGASKVLSAITEAMRIPESAINYHQFLVGGGFGRRGTEQDVIVEAALISKAVAKPVKVIWSREEDMAYGKFRPMTAHFIEAGFDANGKLIAYHHRIACELISEFRGIRRDKNAVDGVLMYTIPLDHYTAIPNVYPECLVQPCQGRISTWRATGTGANSFPIESFMDEVAQAMGKDPLAFRLEIAEGNPRLQHLLRTVAQMANWPKVPEGRALGLATMEKKGTQSAGIADVSVDRSTGKIKVHNFWIAIDSGIAVQPENFRYQTEGSLFMGLGSALSEHILIKKGRVQQSNYTNYNVMRMSDVPNIEVKVVSTDNRPTGGSEDGLPLAAPAIGNAVAALTGVRLRRIPFDPGLLRGALGA